MSLSAVVVAQDEEERIAACIASVRGFCDEVLVVDGGSRDATVRIAEEAGARVVSRPFDDFARQHEFARSEARGTCILSLDADERASDDLARTARPALERGAAAYALPFRNHFRGVWLRHGGFHPDFHLRLFLKDLCRYDLTRPVHEKLIVQGAVERLEAPILHFTCSSLAQCLAKMERYGERAAWSLFAQGRRGQAWEVAFRPLWRFVRGYFLRGGFLDGAAGAAILPFRLNVTAGSFRASFAEVTPGSIPGAGSATLTTRRPPVDRRSATKPPGIVYIMTRNQGHQTKFLNTRAKRGMRDMRSGF